MHEVFEVNCLELNAFPKETLEDCLFDAIHQLT